MDYFATLCDIYDCAVNKDNCCSLNCFFDDYNCKQNRIITPRIVKKSFTHVFEPKNCRSITLNTPSKGAQDKWSTLDNKFIIKDRFYYQLRYWNDDLVEVIASQIGRQLGLNILEQSLCKLGSRECSCTENWGKKRFIPYSKIDPEATYMNYKDLNDRVQSIVDKLSNVLKQDATIYIKSILTIDRLVGNEDRHTDNFGILQAESGTREIAPIFDCGLGLFEHDICYNGLNLEQSIAKMQHRTFGDWRLIDDKYFFHEGTYTISSKLLPNRLAEPYLKFSSDELGMEMVICD